MYQKTSEEGRILKDVRRMTELIDQDLPVVPPTKKPESIGAVDVLRVLGDPMTFEMFMKGIEPHRQKDDNSKKMFYSRLEKLIKAGLVRRIKIGVYEPTARGIIVQEAVQLIEKVLKFSEQLNVCDNYHFLSHGASVSEDLIINAIVTDLELRNILLEKRVTAGAEDPKRYIGPGSG